jgi:hypothetical protein
LVAGLAGLLLCSCLEPGDHPIMPGRYYPAAQAHTPDSATHYYEFSTGAGSDYGTNNYTIVERRSPDCVWRREHGQWSVIGTNQSRKLRLNRVAQYLAPRTSVDGALVFGDACLNDSTPGSALEDVATYAVRAITTTSFDIQACATLTPQTCEGVPVDSRNWAGYSR